MTAPAPLVEACVTSPAEAAECFALGAGRVELCRALEVGGLTPGLDDVHAAVARAGHPVFALVRGQAETFRLAPREVGALVAEVERLAAAGVHGVVVGVLDASGRVDAAAMAELVAAAGGAPVTFHRAFDTLHDPRVGLDALLAAGVARVLTSGGASTAWEGRGVLRGLVAAAGPALSELGGGAVRGGHVRALVEETGLREVHARASAIPGVLAALG